MSTPLPAPGLLVSPVDPLPADRRVASDRPARAAARPPRIVRLARPGAAGRGASWAEVRVAWNPAGLAVAIEATGKSGPITFDEGPTLANGAQIWIDTRDTRDIHRASRFCHRFTAKLSPGGSRTALEVELAQRPIARAVADAPTCRIETLSARAERLSGGLAARAVLPRRGAARLRPGDQSPARLRLPGVRPRPRGPVPGRRPRVPHRRGPQPLVDPGAPRTVIRLA